MSILTDNLRTKGFKVLDLLARFRSPDSGIRWTVEALSEHLEILPIDVIDAIKWLREIDAIDEADGEYVVTERGGRMVAH